VHRTAPLPVRLRRRSAALVVAAAVASLSACGGSDDGGGDAAASSSASAPASTSASSSASASASSSAPAEQGGTLAVTGVDFSFEMDSTDLSAGEYEVTFTNEGSSPHNVVVELDGEDVTGSDVIDPGQSTSFTVALEPGEYVFYCGVGSHRAMGMETPVTVS
jgi:plastocyanin